MVVGLPYDPLATPRLAPGMKFRHDPVRAAWLVLGPERLFLPDEHATAVLHLIDGSRTTAGIVEALAQQFDAPPGVIAADVWDMLGELQAKGVLRLREEGREEPAGPPDPPQ